MRILHVCGGDPGIPSSSAFWMMYSPRMWRWSWFRHQYRGIKNVFSTYVEVILILISWNDITLGILHVCGGDPEPGKLIIMNAKYSPRMWRWSYLFFNRSIWLSVFSTYVEVILEVMNSPRPFLRILHVCGGDPATTKVWAMKMKYSPRMWRWS